MDYRYDELLKYCKSEAQTIIIEDLIETNSQRETSNKLNKSTGTISDTVKRVKGYMDAAKEKEEFNIPSTPGFTTKKISERYNVNEETGDLEVKGGWVQKFANLEDQTILFEDWLVDQATSRVVRATPLPSPEVVLEDLLASYEIGDAHLGVYSWVGETGTDWNLQQGMDILRAGVNHLVNSAPAAKTAYILDTGDFFHSDNQSNRTNHSGHALDVDGRWGQILDAGVQVVIDLIDLALYKHEIVYFRSAEGNHDEHTARMMNLAIKMRYNDEPRVKVLDSAMIHHYFQFGINMLADTHSHTTKPDNLPLIAAVDQPKMWSETTNRIFRIGHIHHHSSKEYPGMTVVSYNTLTPQDVWHRNSGYRSNRTMTCTIYHKLNGCAGTNVVNPTMIGF